MNPLFSRMPTNIFTAMSALAVEHKAVNLGQGFPDQDGPESMRAVAAKALMEGPNQYPLMRGVIPLRAAIADHARNFYGLAYDPVSEIVVNAGATEAVANALIALVTPGDEVVLIEPSFDIYRPLAQAAGAVIKTITLQPPHWRLTAEALKAAITAKTRVVLLNNPVNPIGRVFSAEELNALADAVRATDAVVISDEVYEHFTFDGRGHIPFASLPGMRERSVRIGSAGKIFSFTGWRVGWVMGPKAMMYGIANVHQFVTFAAPPAQQLGVAHGLAHEMDFPLNLSKQLQANRDLLASGLSALGFDVLPAEGTYFLTAGIAAIATENDRAFCGRMAREGGVAAIPLSAFFAEGGPKTYIRFAVCKQRAVLEEALARLKAWLSG
jgi:N-succinyldiaminopimelate aminotransferase